MYYGLKNLSKAEEMFEETLRITPDHIGTLYNLGAVRTEAGKCPAAMKTLARLTELVPHHVKAWTKLGYCYLKMNERAQAKAAYELVLEKDPSNTEALNNLGNVNIISQGLIRIFMSGGEGYVRMLIFSNTELNLSMLTNLIYIHP